MNIVHVLVVFEDQFSGAKETKIITTSEPLFNKMKDGIGSTFSHFDKKAQIRYDYKVIEVRQAVPDDYKDGECFINEPNK